jgi:16S rRNA (uracil1498-N3)-methyltransferase
LKAYHPKLNEPCKLKDFLLRAEGEKYIAHCMEGTKTTLKESITKHEAYTILIGPEGDFSPAELENAVSRGYHPLALGSSRLRTETAALEACFEINFLNR